MSHQIAFTQLPQIFSLDLQVQISSRQQLQTFVFGIWIINPSIDFAINYQFKNKKLIVFGIIHDTQRQGNKTHSRYIAFSVPFENMY